MRFGISPGRKRRAKKSAIVKDEPHLTFKDFKSDLSVAIELYEQLERPVPIKCGGEDTGWFLPRADLENPINDVLEVKLDRFIAQRLLLLPAAYWGLAIVIKTPDGNEFILKPAYFYVGTTNSFARLRLDDREEEELVATPGNRRELADLLSRVLREMRSLSHDRHLVTVSQEVGRLGLRLDQFEKVVGRRSRRNSTNADDDQTTLDLGPKKPNGAES